MFLNVARFHDISVLQFYGAKLSGAMFFSQKFTINQRRAEALLPQGPMWWHLFQVGCISSTLAQACRCARWHGGLAGAPLEASEDAQCHRDRHREHGQQWSNGTNTGSCGCHQQQGDWPKPPREASSRPSRSAHRDEFDGTFGAWCDANGGLQHCRPAWKGRCYGKGVRLWYVGRLHIYILLYMYIIILNIHIYILYYIYYIHIYIHIPDCISFIYLPRFSVLVWEILIFGWLERFNLARWF